MNDDVLAAIVVAARRLTARDPLPTVAPGPTRWILASRLRIGDPRRARLAAAAGSRWAVRGRLDG